MAKPNVADFVNPITGHKGNLFDLKGIWHMILGVVVFIFIFFAGEKLVHAISGKTGVAISASNPLPSPQPTAQHQNGITYL